jgi:hypothetical protein
MIAAASASGIDWAAVTAAITGIAGLLAAWKASRKAREEGEQSCHETLVAAREESEHYAAQLHRVRMTHPELVPEAPK